MTTDGTDAVAELFEVIAAADAHGPVPHDAGKMLSGLSGRKTIGLLQRLAAKRASGPGRCYLEIGVFQGLTLLSVALAAPTAECYGVDDFSILDMAGENLGIVKKRIADVGARNAHLINADYEAALGSVSAHIGSRRIGVCFIDGAHDYRSQLMALLLVERHLTEDAVVVVDDTNYAFVRRATDDFLATHPDWRLVFDAYSPGHPANLDAATLARFESGWLNGIHVLTRVPDGVLPDMRPPLSDDRGLYVNDWQVHRHGLAELAPEALELASAIVRGDDAKERGARAALIERHRVLGPNKLGGRFPDRNTHSGALPESRLNRKPGGR